MELSNVQKLKHLATKPAASALIAFGTSVLLGENSFEINIPKLGMMKLPYFYAGISAATSLITSPVALWLMPHITPHLNISNHLFLPLVAGGANQIAFKIITGSMQEFKPFVNGIKAEVGASYIEDNFVTKI